MTMLNRQKLPDPEKLERAKEEQREYQRQYRRKNKDKVRKWNQNYWLRRAERQMTQDAEVGSR